MNGLWKSVMEAVVVAVAVAGVAVAGGPGRAGRQPRGGRARMTKADLINGKAVPGHGPRVNRPGPAEGNPFKRGLDGKGDDGLRRVPRHRDAWDWRNNPERFGGATPEGVFHPGGWGLKGGPNTTGSSPSVNGMDSETEVIELAPRGRRPFDSPGDDTFGVGRARGLNPATSKLEVITGGAGIIIEGGDTFARGAHGLLGGSSDPNAGCDDSIFDPGAWGLAGRPDAGSGYGIFMPGGWGLTGGSGAVGVSPDVIDPLLSNPRVNVQ